MSLETLVSADLKAGGKISPKSLAYLAERARSNCYDYVMRRFGGSKLSKAELARRIGKDPAQINRMLATSGNWTIGTMAELLAAISEEEFIPSSLPLAGRAARNFTQADLLAQLESGEEAAPARPASVTSLEGSWKTDSQPVRKRELRATIKPARTILEGVE